MKNLRAYCELVRLPNVFTAMADILAGYWLICGRMEWSPRLGWLLAASACLYSAGIVLNDLHDIETDRNERPTRPLPLRRISTRAAWRWALSLTLVGLLASMLAGLDGSNPSSRPFTVALALVVAIVAYDFALKKTPIGPLIMAACRALNFLLAVSTGALVTGALLNVDVFRHVNLIAAGIFLYVASFTYFGRDEAARSSRGKLIAGGVGIAIALWIIGSVSIVRSGYLDFTLILWIAVAIHVGRVTLRAIRRPGPSTVQYAMKTYIFCIIALDAVIASSVGGWRAGLAILALLVPALVLGRWVYST